MDGENREVIFVRLQQVLSSVGNFCQLWKLSHFQISEPNKLWEELLLRSFAQKIEIEIQSPVADQYKTLDSELEKLNVRGEPGERDELTTTRFTQITGLNTAQLVIICIA